LAFWFELLNTPKQSVLEPDKLKTSGLSGTDYRFLGSGGFGETWAVTEGGITLAFKFLMVGNYPPTRFAREAEGLRRATGENLSCLLKTGHLDYEGKSLPYIVSAFIPGLNLNTCLCSGQWPSFSEARTLIRGLLTGLVALHEKSMIHRDLKPENIILRDTAFSCPVIIDFGLVKILDDNNETRYPAIMGTAPFMAPEQVMGLRPMKSTDLWALGVIMYLLMTRKHPFYGNRGQALDSDEALDALNSGFPDLPSDTPRDLAELTMRFLSPEPYQRGSAKRALSDLEV